MDRKIRTSDNKGRISVGQGNVPYAIYTDDDGVITAHPIVIPDAVPALGKEDLRAVYVSPAHYGSDADTVTIFSRLTTSRLLQLVYEIAREEMIPVVVDASGIGGSVADALSELKDLDVVVKYRRGMKDDARSQLTQEN